MAIQVRPATTADDPEIRSVGEAAFAAARRIYRPNSAAISNLTSIAPTLTRLVAEADGELLGTVRYGIVDDRLRIIGLGVKPGFQRRGVARRLLDELAVIGKEHRCRALGLYTIVQTGNVAVFRALGFQVISEQPDEYFTSVDGSPLTEAHMERPID